MMPNEKLNIQPNLFLIGAMRAGSTSIHMLLDQHPEIFMSQVKEPMYFVAEAMRCELKKGDNADLARRLSQFVKHRQHATATTYAALFKTVTNEKYFGESSHYIYHPEVVKVIHEECPDARIIVSLRNPVERLYSEYLLYYRQGSIENKTFAEFVRERHELDKDGQQLKSGPSIINKGLYFDLLIEWIDVFGDAQVKIILFEDFTRDYLKICQSVYEWLEVDPSFVPTPIHAQQGGIPKSRALFDSIENNKLIKTMFIKKMVPKMERERLRSIWYKFLLKKDEIDPQTRKILKKIYREDIEKVEREFHLDLTAWK
jgi:hypothetical protein